MNNNASTAIAAAEVQEMLLTEAQTARILGVEPITLRMWRWRDRKRATGCQPKSPPYVRVGVRSVRYPMDKLRAWIRALPTVDGVPQLPDNRRHPDTVPVSAPAAQAEEHAAAV